MKKILLAVLFLFPGICRAQYEVAKSTFNASAVNVSSGAPTLISLAPSKVPGMAIYSVTLFNISSSSAVYTLSPSSSNSGVPALTCANGLIIGAGTETDPCVVTEQFERLYMWALACGNSDVIIRRAVRGR